MIFTTKAMIFVIRSCTYWKCKEGLLLILENWRMVVMKSTRSFRFRVRNYPRCKAFILLHLEGLSFCCGVWFRECLQNSFLLFLLEVRVRQIIDGQISRQFGLDQVKRPFKSNFKEDSKLNLPKSSCSGRCKMEALWMIVRCCNDLVVKRSWSPRW